MRLVIGEATKKALKFARNPKLLFHRLRSIVRDRSDFLAYRTGLVPFRRMLRTMSEPVKGGLLIVSGSGMNTVWAEIWTLLSLSGRMIGLKPYVLTTRNQESLNRYYRLLDIELIFQDDLLTKRTASLPVELTAKLAASKTFADFRDIVIDRIPLGDIALSTYCRYFGTGLVDVSRAEVRKEVSQWVERVWQAANMATYLFSKYDIKATYHSEVFMEEYGGIYYAALNANLKILRFAGTVRDDAVIIQHRSWKHDRLHHAALADTTWDRLKNQGSIDIIQRELEQNFAHRYGDKWHRSKRNQPNTHIMEISMAREQLGVPANRKIAVIYSHILYDTIFFFGSDLFKDYATWLIETVREAVLNTSVEWYIKVHPSNIWRGEMGTVFSHRYEEERLIEEHIGQLPSHVHVVPADTPISPLTWMKMADFGITVRGTSGLEMAALGGTVITAGTGRYEGRGFTYDPPNQDAYRELLGRLPDIPCTTPAQTELAQRYAHGIFILKPYTLTALAPRLRAGRKKLVASDDLIYLPQPLRAKELPNDLRELADFLLDDSRVDLLSDASYFVEESTSRSATYAVSS